jgi:hypothetical protein
MKVMKMMRGIRASRHMCGKAGKLHDYCACHHLLDCGLVVRLYEESIFRVFRFN